MKAPEKIYLENVYPDNGVLPLGLNYNYNKSSNDTEYVRTDASIDHACELLNKMIYEVIYKDLQGDSTQHYDKNEFIEDFRHYMEDWNGKEW